MKIGIIHPSFEMIAGAEKTTLSLLEGLKKTNHTTTLYTFLPPKIEEEKNFSNRKYKSLFIELNKEIDEFEITIGSKKIKTITDLESYMILGTFRELWVAAMD